MRQGEDLGLQPDERSRNLESGEIHSFLRTLPESQVLKDQSVCSNIHFHSLVIRQVFIGKLIRSGTLLWVGTGRPVTKTATISAFMARRSQLM